MTESDAITLITREIRALSSNFVAADYADAVDAAERETGFVFPNTSDFQTKWLLSRTKRALFFSLLSENVTSFKFKQINLQDKFKNLKQIVSDMDKDFETAQTEYMSEFANVEELQMFGHKADAGFSYDDFGRETTFDTDQVVSIHPSSEDTSED